MTRSLATVARHSRTCLWIGAAAAALLQQGCASGPRVLSPNEQTIVDRTLVDYPAGFVLRPFMVNLTAATAFCFDETGKTLFVAEGGGTEKGLEPHIFGYRFDAASDKQFFDIYPIDRHIPFFRTGFQIYGPVGGMVFRKGHLYVTHQDEADDGVVTAFGLDGSHTTIAAGIPARGDYKMGGITADDAGRLYFGVGAATNSGVVGLDNWQLGWVRRYEDFCDIPYQPIRLLGQRFDSPNPRAGVFGGASIGVTGSDQPFNVGDRVRIAAAANGRPTAAIYSVAATGGDLKVEAWGVRNARGLACDLPRRIYFTNDGMEPRGTRPIMNDPDSVDQLYPRNQGAQWMGFPDYTSSMESVADLHFQPQPQMIKGTGYLEVGPTIDLNNSDHLPPPDKANWLKGMFLPQAGAAGLDVVPAQGDFHDFRGSLIVALFGDRAPFSTGGDKGPRLTRPTGYKIARVDLLSKQVTDFVYNTHIGPASASHLAGRALERPVDVKFGPDGSMYILDYGSMSVRDGANSPDLGTGKIWRLTVAPAGTVQAK